MICLSSHVFQHSNVLVIGKRLQIDLCRFMSHTYFPWRKAILIMMKQKIDCFETSIRSGLTSRCEICQSVMTDPYSWLNGEINRLTRDSSKTSFFEIEQLFSWNWTQFNTGLEDQRGENQIENFKSSYLWIWFVDTLFDIWLLIWYCSCVDTSFYSCLPYSEYSTRMTSSSSKKLLHNQKTEWLFLFLK